MLKEVANNIYQVELPMSYNLGTVNSYLVKDRHGYAIFDTGECNDKTKAIWCQIIEEGYEIRKIVITHMHPDHLGLVSWFVENYDTEVIVAEKGYDKLLIERNRFVDGKYINEDMNQLVKLFGVTQQTDSPEIDYYQYEIYQFEPTTLFKDDDTITIGDFHFKAIWTPGHSIDHFTFYEEAHEIFVTGDHILPDINPVILPEKDDKENALEMYFNSLDQVSDLKTKVILPGHGEVFQHLKERIIEKKERYFMRFRQMLKIVEDVPKTPNEIAEEIYDDHNNPTITMQTHTNATYLEGLGYVTIEDKEGVRYIVANEIEQVDQLVFEANK